MVERSPAQLLIWAVAVVLLLGAAWRLLQGERRPAAVPVGLERPVDRPPRTGGSVYVHVAGAVKRPGLYRLFPGARVAAAIERAGGAVGRAELAGVNLAAPVKDGQQILVPRAGGGRGGPSAAVSPEAHAGAGKLSLAAATAEQLEGLDGIGPTLAKRILEYRDSHGGFRSIDELKQVDGIGDKRFAALRDAVQP